MTLLHKTLSSKDALEYILFAVLLKDLPEDIDKNAELTAEVNEDGEFEIFVDIKEEQRVLC